MVTCHGHSPGGQSSPLTIRVIVDIWWSEASWAFLWLVPLLNSSSSCSVELVELLLSDFVPLVLVFGRYRKIVLKFSVIIPPHLKVSARVYIRFEGFSLIFLLGQSHCLSFFLSPLDWQDLSSGASSYPSAQEHWTLPRTTLQKCSHPPFSFSQSCGITADTQKTPEVV